MNNKVMSCLNIYPGGAISFDNTQRAYAIAIWYETSIQELKEAVATVQHKQSKINSWVPRIKDQAPDEIDLITEFVNQLDKELDQYHTWVWPEVNEEPQNA